MDSMSDRYELLGLSMLVLVEYCLLLNAIVIGSAPSTGDGVEGCTDSELLELLRNNPMVEGVLLDNTSLSTEDH